MKKIPGHFLEMKVEKLIHWKWFDMNNKFIYSDHQVYQSDFMAMELIYALSNLFVVSFFSLSSPLSLCFIRGRKMQERNGSEPLNL